MEVEGYYFLLCFDYTKERFGQIITLPFSAINVDTVALSCVKEEKLAVLYQPEDTSVIERWMTTMIEPNDASWSKFLRVDMKALTGLDFQFDCDNDDSFIIDEEKKVTVLFSYEESESYNKAYIIGEKSGSNLLIKSHRYLNIVDLEKVLKLQEPELVYRFLPLVCSSSYVPSLVQIKQIAVHKGKYKKRKRTKKVKFTTARKEED